MSRLILSDVEFQFRAWVPCKNGDPPEWEVWYHGLEEAIRVSDWALASIQEEDPYESFGLDPTKHWQVIGHAVIRAWYDYDGEPDQELTIAEFEKAEVLTPPDFGDRPCGEEGTND